MAGVSQHADASPSGGAFVYRGSSDRVPLEPTTNLTVRLHPMRCSEFRDLHCAFIDDTLAGVELVRMQRHIAECPECAARDARVRRALMVARSIPPIEPSPDFAARLDRRLRSCAAEGEQHAGTSFRTVASVGLVMSAAMLLYLAESLPVGARVPQTRDIVLPPVIAMATPPAASTPSAASDALVSDSASNSARVIVASVGVGVPIWPVGALVEQPSLQLASYTQGR